MAKQNSALLPSVVHEGDVGRTIWTWLVFAKGWSTYIDQQSNKIYFTHKMFEGLHTLHEADAIQRAYDAVTEGDMYGH